MAAPLSARSGSRGRSRSRSPIRGAVGAISGAYSEEGGPGEVLPRASNNEEQVARKPAKKSSPGKMKGRGGKKKEPTEATSRYLGVSFHTRNRRWRTTVYYGASASLYLTSLW